MEWLAEQIMGLIDFVNTGILDALGCDMSTFTTLFPVADMMYSIFIAIGLGILLLNFVWQLFKNFGLGIGIEAEDPFKLTMRSILFMLLVLNAREIVDMILRIAGKPYDWIMNASIPPLEFGNFISVLVKVMSIDRTNPERLGIAVSIRDCFENPAQENIEKCHTQGKYIGKVTGMDTRAIYVRLNVGVNGIATACHDRKVPGRKDDVSLAMSGVGEVLAPRIIGEIGDIRRFHSSKALVAFAGIDAPPYQSGNFTGTKRRISKRGSAVLRKTGYEIIQCIKTIKPANDAAVYDFIVKKEQEGKPKKVANIAGLNKFLRIYYARVTEVYQSV